jgi:hypothetical protein
MGPKTFNHIIDHMFPKRKQYWGLYGDVFDYPDYAGLPSKISYKLSSEAVDAMQFVIDHPYKNKREFARAYKRRLIELGERNAHTITIK